jgi:hypothetical protein
MQKPQKEKKYITLENGEDFRTIAKIMSQHDFKMNHATARNQLIFAMQKLINDTASNIKLGKVKFNDIEKVLKEQDLSNDFSDMLYLVYKSYLEELNEELNEKRKSATQA